MKISCNEKELEIDSSTTGSALVEKLHLQEPSQAAAIYVNGIAKDFSETLNPLDNVEILSFDDKRGKEVFWHSSAHIMAQAILRLWPEAMPTIGPAIDAGFYYDFANLSLSEDDFPKIEEEIQKIVKENYKPEKTVFKSKQDALNSFKNNPYKQELISDLPDEISLLFYCIICLNRAGGGSISSVKLSNHFSDSWNFDRF